MAHVDGFDVSDPTPNVSGRHRQVVEHLGRELVERQRRADAEFEAARAEIHRLRRRVKRRSRALRQAQGELVEAERQLAAVRASVTWRVGTAVLWLPRLIKGALRGGRRVGVRKSSRL